LRIALEHFNAQRCALLIAQQPDHDLQLAALAVAVVAEGA
jgi:hypothetical protein